MENESALNLISALKPSYGLGPSLPLDRRMPSTQLSSKSRIASSNLMSRVSIDTKKDLTGDASTGSYDVGCALSILNCFIVPHSK